MAEIYREEGYLILHHEAGSSKVMVQGEQDDDRFIDLFIRRGFAIAQQRFVNVTGVRQITKHEAGWHIYEAIIQDLPMPEDMHADMLAFAREAGYRAAALGIWRSLRALEGNQMLRPLDRMAFAEMATVTRKAALRLEGLLKAYGVPLDD
jgi:hypothetical protein